MTRQLCGVCGVVTTLLVLAVEPAVAQYRGTAWTAPPLRLQAATDAGAPTTWSAETEAADGQRWSPGWVRFAGGLVGATATLAGLVAATWDDPDAVAEPVVYGAYVLGTWFATAVPTAFWEKPNAGILAGAAIGALPLLAAMGSDDDDTAGTAMLVAWIGAPLGAAIGQRVRSPRPPR
jgi:hypothetical protein